MADWLSPEQLIRLTKKRRASAQCRALAQMGVPFKPNAIGEPLVSASLFFEEGGERKKKAQPNWDAIKHGKAA